MAACDVTGGTRLGEDRADQRGEPIGCAIVERDLHLGIAAIAHHPAIAVRSDRQQSPAAILAQRGEAAGGGEAIGIDDHHRLAGKPATQGGATDLETEGARAGGVPA